MTADEYQRQVRTYVDLAARLARSDVNRLAELVERIDDLPSEGQDELAAYLESPDVEAFDEADRARLWTELLDVVNKHQVFADADWAMPAERVEVLAAVALRLEPSRPALRYRRLFSQRDVDLFEAKGDFEAQRESLDLRRREAVSEIRAAGGVAAVTEQAGYVEAPATLGIAFGQVGNSESDEKVLPDLLRASEAAAVQLAGGYIWARFRGEGWPWVESLHSQQWSPEDTAQLLAFLPFDAPAWRHARALGDAEAEYWRRTPANPFEVTEAAAEAVASLVDVGRPRAAVRVLAAQAHRKLEIPPKLAAAALLAAVESDESLHQSDSYDMVEVIQVLQADPKADPADLFAVEWAYVPLLDRGLNASPSLLEKMLATDPDFYLRIIRSIFRPSRAEGAESRNEITDSSEEQKAVARNAYELLHTWRRPPGQHDDGTFDPAALRLWWTAVRASSAESGHREIAETMLGHVLAHAPADPDGTWVHRGVATLLNEPDSKDMRQGFRLEIFNSRGAHFASGGSEERELARQFGEKADRLDDIGLHRVATEVRQLAKVYEHEAAREAERALRGD